jgi:hypothetical protein
MTINFNDFIHSCYIECARKFYLNPLLFYHNLSDTEIKKNQLEILIIINDSIKNVIRYKIDYNDIINNINFNNNIDLVNNKNIIYDNKNKNKIKNHDIINIKNKNDNNDLFNIKNNKNIISNNDLFNNKSNKNIISNNDNKFIKSINYKNKLNTFNKKDETSIYEPFLNNVLDEYDNCK